MMRCVIAGLVYSLIVFLLGFGLGVFRILLVVPHVGETMAVLSEIPIILGASWVVCGWCIRRYDVAAGADSRVLMGAVAFTLLITAELVTSVTLFGRTRDQLIASYQTTPGAIGLAAQLAFGLLPLLRCIPHQMSGTNPMR